MNEQDKEKKRLLSNILNSNIKLLETLGKYEATDIGKSVIKGQIENNNLALQLLE